MVARGFTPTTPFDLDHGFVLWTPNGSGGFDVRTVLPSSAPGSIAGAGGPLLTGHSLFLERLVDGSMRVHGLAEKGARYTVEASENLIEWRPIATNIAGTNLWNYLDSAATNLNKCFYRAVKQ